VVLPGGGPGAKALAASPVVSTKQVLFSLEVAFLQFRASGGDGGAGGVKFFLFILVLFIGCMKSSVVDSDSYICMFLHLPDPDHSIINQNSKKRTVLLCDFFMTFYLLKLM
jgi:hypothetical protein